MSKQNPQHIMSGEMVYIRQQSEQWSQERIDSIEFVGDMLCAKFNKGWSYIGLSGDGIKRENPNNA